MNHRRWNLLLLGLIAMTLSEAFSWNVRPLAEALQKGPVALLSALLLTWLAYTVMLALVADARFRYRVQDLTGLLLLGFLYGMVNEGIIAGMLYHPFPPRFLGVSLLMLGFLGGWHAFIDTGVGFFVFQRLRQGCIDLSQPRISLRNTGWILLLALTWFPWQWSRWQQEWHPGGMDPRLQAIMLLSPLILLALVLPRALRESSDPFQQGVLTSRERKLAWGFLTLFLLRRLIILPVRLQFAGWLCCWIVFVLLFRFTRPPANNPDHGSLQNVSTDLAAAFSRRKFLLGSLLLLGLYLIFQKLTVLLPLLKIWSGLSVLMVVTLLAGSALFFIYSLFQAIRMVYSVSSSRR